MKPAWYYEQLEDEREEERIENILELRSRLAHLITRAERVEVQEAIRCQMRAIRYEKMAF